VLVDPQRLEGRLRHLPVPHGDQHRVAGQREVLDQQGAERVEVVAVVDHHQETRLSHSGLHAPPHDLRSTVGEHP
jgi:hypothetical protein